MKQDCYLITHDKCMDGLLAGGLVHAGIDYIGINELVYPALVPVEQFFNRDLIICDYVVPAETLIALLKQGNRVFCIDHHIASFEHYYEVYNNIDEPHLLANFAVCANTKMSAAALTEMIIADISDIHEGKTQIVASQYTVGDIFCVGFDVIKIEKLMNDFAARSEPAELDSLMLYLSNSDTYAYPLSLTTARHIRLGMEHAYEVEPDVDFTTYYQLYRRYKDDWSELERIGKEIEESQLPELDAIIIDGTTFDVGHSSDIRGQFTVMYAEHAVVNNLAQRAFALNPNLWFIVAARKDPNNPDNLLISTRGQNSVNPFNLSDICKPLGGGGHFNAAGGTLVNCDDKKYRDVFYWNDILDAGAKDQVHGILKAE